MSDRDTPAESTEAEIGARFCGYGSCDGPPGCNGPHRCRCSKPVDASANGCKWHTPGPAAASDRDTMTALEMHQAVVEEMHRLLAVLKVYDPAAETSTHEQVMARALHATSRFPGAYRDDSPTWITPPSRRLVLAVGESVTLDGPAVVLHLPIAPKEPRDGE